MKQFLFLSILALTSQAAFAQTTESYQCTSPQGETLWISYTEGSLPNTPNTKAIFTQNSKSVNLSGVGVFDASTLFVRLNADLFTEDGEEAKVKLVERAPIGRGGCGRVSCDFMKKIISAKLEYNGIEFNFDCI